MGPSMWWMTREGGMMDGRWSERMDGWIFGWKTE